MRCRWNTIVRIHALLVVVVSILVSNGISKGQTTTGDTVRTVRNVSPPNNAMAGLDIGYGWASNNTKGWMLAASYRTALGSVDLEGFILQRWFNNDRYSLGHFGFGFGFLVIKPRLVQFGSSALVLEPALGFDFTVWTNTVGAGIPMGVLLRLPVVPSFDVAVGAVFEPQFNLNAEKNTRIFDLRIGIRYH